MARIPTLRKHKTGNFFCRWGGKDHYFGRDRKAAEGAYLDSLSEWREWQDSRNSARRLIYKSSPTVLDLADEFCRAKFTEVGFDAEVYYRGHLRRFVHFYGKFSADAVRPFHLQKLKEAMLRQGFAPKTVNHDLTAVRVMYNWASGLELIPPMSLKGVKNMPLGPPPDRSLPVEVVQKKIGSAPVKVRHWLAVNYMALLRPVEVVRCVQGEGEWVEEGVFALERGKMDKRVAFKRHCVFSPAALDELRRCEKTWSHIDAYSHAAVSLAKLAPGILRHSAATHLIRVYHAEPGDVELLLGHVGGRLRMTYWKPPFQRLREIAARIVL